MAREGDEGSKPLLEREDSQGPPTRNSSYGAFDSGVQTPVTPSSLESQDFNTGASTPATEDSPLLGESYSKVNDEDAHITSFWKHEAKTIIRYSTPMCITLLLQYSLTISSIFVVGHIGKEELGAVSLANMTAIISGYAIYQGFATCLDTLCPQAYGSGKLKLVGLHTQRLTLLLLITTIPIALIWLQAETIFRFILPKEDKHVAVLAGSYLRIILMGAPGYACFEAGKRYVQAQGLFHTSLHVLLLCAPLNAVMSWFFVWKLNWGFHGAPIAVAITQNLLPILLFINTKVSTRHLPSCWHPLFTRSLFQNWKPMMRLAIPGMLNIESEFIAWEILTLISSYLGSTALATQSALYSIVCITYQVSFSASIGSSTRLAMLVGAGRVRRAIVAEKVALGLSIFMGSFNVAVIMVFRNQLPLLFTNDLGVQASMRSLLPICAALQIFDALNTTCNGILRAAGRPAIGSYVQLAFYYGVSLPLGIGLAFWAGWGLTGIWTGMCVGMVIIGVVSAAIVVRIDWVKAVGDADARNELEG